MKKHFSKSNSLIYIGFIFILLVFIQFDQEVSFEPGPHYGFLHNFGIPVIIPIILSFFTLFIALITIIKSKETIGKTLIKVIIIFIGILIMIFISVLYIPYILSLPESLLY